MVKKLFLGVLIIALLIISFSAYKYFSLTLYDPEEPSFLQDIGIENSLNNDNIIFRPGYTFVYAISFIDSLNNPQALCLDLTFLGKIGHDLVPANEAIERLYCINKLHLIVNSNKGNSILGDSQTIIKYDYYDDEKRVFLGEITGVIEDSDRIFLHPPRNYYFVINEFNPFPQVLFPIEEHDYWELEFGIPEHYLQTVSRLKDASLKISYKYLGKELHYGPLGIDSVYKFSGIGRNSEIVTKSNYLFSKQNGFVEMEFLSIDGVKLKMVLECILNKS